MFPARNDRQETITCVNTLSFLLRKEKQDRFLKCVLYFFNIGEKCFIKIVLYELPK